MLKNLFDLLRRPASTSKEIAATLKEVADALPQARSTIKYLENERRKKLPFASDEELQKLEEQIAKARREADRIEAASEYITARHADKIAAEERAELDRERADVELLAGIVSKKLSTDYPKLASALTAMITELEVAEASVEAVNKKLLDAGRAAERLPPIEVNAIKFAVTSYRDMFRLNTVSLPPAPGFPGFGEAAIRAQLDGAEV